MAAADLGCAGKPIEYVPVSSKDYREVEARGCEKKATYRFVKVSFVEKWERSSAVSAL